MKRHRRPRPRVSKQLPPANLTPDLESLLYLLRDNLRRADAMITTAEGLLEQSWGDKRDDDEEDEGEGEGILRYRMRIEYLVEACKLAVRAAGYTAEQIDAEIAAHKRRA